MAIPITSARVNLQLNSDLRSEEMRCEHVNDCRDHEKEEQGHVKNVPEPEEAFIECQGCGLLHGGDMQRHEVCHAGELLVPNPLRSSKPPAFDRDYLPRIGNQPPANDGSAPADDRQRDQPGENATSRS